MYQWNGLQGQYWGPAYWLSDHLLECNEWRLMHHVLYIACGLPGRTGGWDPETQWSPSIPSNGQSHWEERRSGGEDYQCTNQCSTWQRFDAYPKFLPLLISEWMMECHNILCIPSGLHEFDSLKSAEVSDFRRNMRIMTDRVVKERNNQVCVLVCHILLLSLPWVLMIKLTPCTIQVWTQRVLCMYPPDLASSPEMPPQILERISNNHFRIIVHLDHETGVSVEIKSISSNLVLPWPFSLLHQGIIPVHFIAICRCTTHSSSQLVAFHLTWWWWPSRSGRRLLGSPWKLQMLMCSKWSAERITWLGITLFPSSWSVLPCAGLKYVASDLSNPSNKPSI